MEVAYFMAWETKISCLIPTIIHFMLRKLHLFQQQLHGKITKIM